MSESGCKSSIPSPLWVFMTCYGKSLPFSLLPLKKYLLRSDLQQTSKWSKLSRPGYRHSSHFFCGGRQTLVPWWDEYLHFGGDCYTCAVCASVDVRIKFQASMCILPYFLILPCMERCNIWHSLCVKGKKCDLCHSLGSSLYSRNANVLVKQPSIGTDAPRQWCWGSDVSVNPHENFLAGGYSLYKPKRDALEFFISFSRNPK